MRGHEGVMRASICQSQSLDSIGKEPVCMNIPEGGRACEFVRARCISVSVRVRARAKT